ncbi:unnamed protein product, partial [marine sediment metagenome]
APRVREDIIEAREESFQEVMAVNLQGPYFLTQGVARYWQIVIILLAVIKTERISLQTEAAMG